MQQDNQTTEPDVTIKPLACPKCGLELGEGLLVCPRDGTELMMMPDVGQVFASKYQFIDRIAAGGMGVIFKAKQLGLNRTVALKVPKITAANVNALRRFQQEAQALARLDHPNLVKVFELGASEYGVPYTAMEFVDGKGLDTLIKERGHLSLKQAINIFRQICDGLQYVHEQGILHRDLKPSNIMLINAHDENPTVKLVDFGIAKIVDSHDNLTQTGEVFGSPLYMSPEQLRTLPVDERSDIYSLGAVMYESLTGIKIFSGQSVVELIIKHLREQPRPLNSVMRGTKYPNALETIVHKCLEKEPAMRYQSISELSADLKYFAEQNREWYHISVPDLGVMRQSPWFNRTVAAAAAAIVLISIAVIVYHATQRAKVANVPALQEKKEVERDIDNAVDLMDINVVRDKVLKQGQDEKLSLRDLLSNEINPVAESPSATPTALKFLKERRDNYITVLLADSHAVNDTFMPYFSVYPLIELNVGGSRMTAASIPAIAKIHTLENLVVDFFKLKESDFEQLSKLDRITVFSATRTQFDDSCVKWIAKFSHLKDLTLGSDERFTDRGAIELAAAKLPLFHLAVPGTSIGDKGVEALAALPIQDLDLTADPVTDKCFAYLAQMKNLRALALADCENLTDQGLRSFKPVRLLKLRLGMMNRFTRDAINDFVQRTGCVITTDGT
ncbi:MAG TPA: protein kinase [Trichormus sp.]